MLQDGPTDAKSHLTRTIVPRNPTRGSVLGPLLDLTTFLQELRCCFRNKTC